MVVSARGGSFGEHFWEMVGVIECLWQVSPTPLGRACWRCLVVLFRLGVPLTISALGGDVLHPLYVLLLWRVVWGLWSPDFCGRPLVGFGRCVAVWCLYGVGWCFLFLWM